MNTTRRLMLASAGAALCVGNTLPVVGVLLGQMSWHDLVSTLLAINLVYVVPVMAAAAIAAIVIARDPDFETTPAGYASATLLLVTFVVYFLLLLAWLPVMKALELIPPDMPTGGPVTLFMILVAAVMAAAPGWLLYSIGVRWARTDAMLPGRAAAHGSGRK